MKAIYLIAFFTAVLFVSGFNTKKINQDKIKYTGTYIGLNDDYMFEFKDDNNKSTLFNEVIDSVEINLYDDEYISKKFELTYENYKIEVLDDDDEPTGETQDGKRILVIKQL